MEKAGGLRKLTFLELMEWYMKVMLDLLSAIDHVKWGGNADVNAEKWPTHQLLKQLFADICKPLEEFVAFLTPLPPYQTTRSVSCRIYA